jgi:hypothetical protein
LIILLSIKVFFVL